MKKYTYFRPEVIKEAIEIHNKSRRQKWRYKEITDKQKEFLKDLIAPKDLCRIDRGAAAVLIGIVIRNNIEASAYSDTDPYGDGEMVF